MFADALVSGIYAGDPKLLSLPACFPRVAELEREYGSVIKGFAKEAKKRRAAAAAKGEAYERPGKMWSFAGGLRVMIEALTAQLKTPPVLGVGIRSILKEADAGRPLWRIRADGLDAWQADAVVMTCPAYQQAKILGELDHDTGDADRGDYSITAHCRRRAGLSQERCADTARRLRLHRAAEHPPRSARRAMVLVDLSGASARRLRPPARDVRRLASGRCRRLGRPAPSAASRARRIDIGSP